MSAEQRAKGRTSKAKNDRFLGFVASSRCKVGFARIVSIPLDPIGVFDGMHVGCSEGER